MTYIELKYQERRVEKVLVLMQTLREEFPLNKMIQESWRCGLVMERFLIVSQVLVSMPFTEKEKRTIEHKQMKPPEGLNCSCLDKDENQPKKFTPPAEGMVP